MLHISSGVDLIEIDRVIQAIDRHGDRFLTRVFTPQELDELKGNPASLAGRFAAKEAVAKALGTGIGQIAWQEIEILRGPAREPILHLHGMAAELSAQKNLTNWSVSLSHTQSLAVATVFAVGQT
jgi:holo-[acyl-carrier protein] synthase